MFNSNTLIKTIVYAGWFILIGLIITLGITFLLISYCGNAATNQVRLIHQGIVTDYRFEDNLRYSVTFSDGYMFFTKGSYMAVVDCDLTEITELDLNQTYRLWEFKRNNSENYVLTLCTNYIDKVRVKYPQNIYYVEQESK
jgi:hypothetical protein